MNLDHILDNLKQPEKIDIDAIIRKKWDKYLKHYFYIEHYNELLVGKYIKYTDLNITKLSGGVIIKIHKSNNSIIKLTLKNLKYKTLWDIKPQNCYIYQYSRSTDFFRDLLDNLNYTVVDI